MEYDLGRTERETEWASGSGNRRSLQQHQRRRGAVLRALPVCSLTFSDSPLRRLVHVHLIRRLSRDDPVSPTGAVPDGPIAVAVTLCDADLTEAVDICLVEFRTRGATFNGAGDPVSCQAGETEPISAVLAGS